MYKRNIIIGLVAVFAIAVGIWYALRTTQVTPSQEQEMTPTVQGVPSSAPHVTPPPTPPPRTNGAQAPASTSSGIRGSVSIGPTCPVQRIPPDPNCADRPYATTLVAKNSKGDIVKTFRSNEKGLFVVSLTPGTYSIGPAPSTAFLPRAGFQDVVVQKDLFTDIVVQFDSGIR